MLVAGLGGAFAVALVVAFVLTPLTRQLALAKGFVDRPSSRRLGALKPRLGGVAMFAGFLAAVLLTLPFVPGRTPEEFGKIAGISLGAALVVAIGALDDRFELPAYLLLALQVVAAAIAFMGGVVVDAVSNPLSTSLADSMIRFPLYVALPFTLLWVVGIMNAINFMDGLDGLAAGIVTIAALILATRSIELGQMSIAVLPLALAGATLGFLRFNFHPASLTMGTSGAFFLGYALSTLSVVGGTKAATVLLVLMIPIVDATWIIVQRVAQGRSPFRGDLGHLHHRLLALGLSHRQIVLLLYLLSALLGAMAVAIPTARFKLYAIGGLGVVVLASLFWVARRSLNQRVDS